MSTHLPMFVAVGLMMMAVDGPRDEAAKKDLEKLRGTWTLVSAKLDGKALAEDKVKHTTIVFRGDRFRFPESAEDATSRDGTIAIDPTKTPKHMDAKSSQGEVMLGIYEIEGDDYRVCFAPAGKPRPAAFGSEPGSGFIDQIWKRARTR